MLIILKVRVRIRITEEMSSADPHTSFVKILQRLTTNNDRSNNKICSPGYTYLIIIFQRPFDNNNNNPPVQVYIIYLVGRYVFTNK